jgi:hypothetical protein
MKPFGRSLNSKYHRVLWVLSLCLVSFGAPAATNEGVVTANTDCTKTTPSNTCFLNNLQGNVISGIAGDEFVFNIRHNERMDIVLGDGVETRAELRLIKSPQNRQLAFMDKVSIALTDKQGNVITEFVTLGTNLDCSALISCGVGLRQASSVFDGVTAYGAQIRVTTSSASAIGIQVALQNGSAGPPGADSQLAYSSSIGVTGYTDYVDITDVRDINNNGFPEFAALRITRDGQPEVIIRDGGTKAWLGAIRFFEPGWSWMPMSVNAMPDSSSNGIEEISVVARDEVSGDVFAELRDAKTKHVIRTIPYPK